jgi:hypothetical protein
VSVIIHADHVESPLARRPEVPEIIAGHQTDLMALVAVDSGLGRLNVMRRPGLDLDEAQRVVLPTDEVNLAIASRGTEVARHHDVPQLAEVEVSVIFARSPGPQVLGSIGMSREPVSDSIQAMDNKFCDACRDHRGGNDFKVMPLILCCHVTGGSDHAHGAKVGIHR